MKLERGFLRSKVARRVFGLFVLSALIPMVITAVLSLFQVSTVLTEQHQAQLFHISKNYSMTILHRLQLAQARLEEIGALLMSDESAVKTVEQSWRNQFDAVALIDIDGTVTSLLGAIAAPSVLTQTQQQPRNSGIVVSKDGTSDLRSPEPQVFMRISVSTISSGQRVLLALLNANYLWGDSRYLTLHD